MGPERGQEHQREDEQEEGTDLRASRTADAALAAQRDAHADAAADTDDEGVGALVNNTGLDGDAPSS